MKTLTNQPKKLEASYIGASVKPNVSETIKGYALLHKVTNYEDERRHDLYASINDQWYMIAFECLSFEECLETGNEVMKEMFPSPFCQGESHSQCEEIFNEALHTPLAELLQSHNDKFLQFRND